MSCTVMYQPYAMSYSASSCDRTNNDKKSFKFPHAPSPPESTHSNASSAYSSPGSTGGGAGGGLGAHNAALLSSLSLLPPHIHSPSSVLASASAAAGSSHSNGGGQRRPLTPSCAGSSSSSSASASATITSASQLHSHSHHSVPHHSTSHHAHGAHSLHSSHHHQRSSSSATSSSAASYPHNLSASASATATSSSRDLSHSNSASSSSTSSSNSSHHHQSGGGGSGRAQQSSQQQQQQQVGECSDDDSQNDPPQQHHEREDGDDGAENSRAQYLSANCILYVNYDGNTARVVEEHFHRALSSAYGEKNPPKSLPMSTRNFPPSFWNSNYQPPPSAKTASALATYGAADFYGTAMDYSTAASISAGFPHHHAHAATADPWHYPLGTHHHHQGYHHHHHRPADITYPPMSSTSRFNAAQYGSFLFPSTSAAASRFPGIPTPAQCSAVKGDATAAHVGHHWAAAAAGAARYDGWSDLHLAADYSAAAAAHYSNMTAAAGKAGLDFESNYLQSS